MIPNLLIAGAQKSGTSWLHRMLVHHPAFEMSRRKELSYFSLPEAAYDEGWGAYQENWSTSARWRGESTPHYFWKREGPFGPAQGPDVARRVATRLGADVDVLVSLRDPVSRAISGYWHNFSRGRFDLPTSLFQLAPSMGVIDLGFYRRHHEHWIRTLGAERVHVLLYDDLRADPRAFLAGALEALRAPVDDQAFWRAVPLDKVVHRKDWMAPIREARNPVTATEVAALLELYRDDIAYVEHLIGRDLSEWRDLDVLIARHVRS
ncbi:sulfotransferase family protein [Nocardioides cavernaquae]|uniref:Sulfotransferase domain-containing protein n=1 Tax=Nocardioides cavernaquae TaxID=2321396 RepID=A0A3A5H7M2_9ACTN|nr:sulfotransferase [Nocardioides cavernaquae]RJS46656.1 hypothetical protein D4739_10790 [Nocardioides cavernaquae]